MKDEDKYDRRSNIQQGNIFSYLEIKYEEIMSFQNEFITIELYIKEFTKFVKTKVEKTQKIIDNSIYKIQDQAEKLKELIIFISQQKQSLFGEILK